VCEIETETRIGGYCYYSMLWWSSYVCSVGGSIDVRRRVIKLEIDQREQFEGSNWGDMVNLKLNKQDAMYHNRWS